jgi:hypothetical protein
MKNQTLDYMLNQLIDKCIQLDVNLNPYSERFGHSSKVALFHIHYTLNSWRYYVSNPYWCIGSLRPLVYDLYGGETIYPNLKVGRRQTTFMIRYGNLYNTEKHTQYHSRNLRYYRMKDLAEQLNTFRQDVKYFEWLLGLREDY